MFKFSRKKKSISWNVEGAVTSKTAVLLGEYHCLPHQTLSASSQVDSVTWKQRGMLTWDPSFQVTISRVHHMELKEMGYRCAEGGTRRRETGPQELQGPYGLWGQVGGGANPQLSWPLEAHQMAGLQLKKG